MSFFSILKFSFCKNEHCFLCGVYGIALFLEADAWVSISIISPFIHQSSVVSFKSLFKFIRTHKFVENKQNKPTSCTSLDKCNPFRFPNFMSRSRNLSDSGNKSPDCFSYKDKVGNAEARTVNACSYVYCCGSDTRPNVHYIARHMLSCEWSLPQSHLGQTILAFRRNGAIISLQPK